MIITNKNEESSQVEKRLNRFDISNYTSRQLSNRLILSQKDKKGNQFGGTRSNNFDYTQSQVREMIKGYKNKKNQDNLRDISESLFVLSPQYQRLINYYASMPTYSYAVVPYKNIENVDKKKIEKEYYKVSEFLNNLNIPYNFTKVIRQSMIADIFFGYIYYDNKNVMIQQFPNKICEITSLEGGVYNFSIDLSFFEGNEEAVNYYPSEVQIAFKKYQTIKKNAKNRNSISSWYELSAKESICIKINEGVSEPIPPFAGVFDSIYDINAFKDLRNDKAELDNYKLIVQKLPIRKDSGDNNDFMIDLPMMNYFHSSIEEVAPSNIGVATTPMEIDVITFDKDTADRDNVAKANKDFWDNSGTSQNLFSSDNKTSQGINRSIETDEQVVFTILGQIQRWINRHITLNGYSKNFKCVMIEVTHFSKDDVIKRYIENNQYGFPFKTFLSSLFGLEPVSFASMAFLENEVLELNDKMVPLKSSFNTNGDELEDDGGRPTNEENGVEDSDETSRDRDKPDSTE